MPENDPQPVPPVVVPEELPTPPPAPLVEPPHFPWENPSEPIPPYPNQQQ